MNKETKYIPPEVWEWDKPSGGAFESINKPTAGSAYDKKLPRGKHPLQLYSQGTPNGVKITLMLEELLALGHEGAEYDAWLCRINKGEQFSSGFVEINPNSKIPALLDQSNGKEQRVFESGAILLYLAEKFSEFLPTDLNTRTECLSWLFWQMGSTPYLGGGFGHFYSYAPEKFQYPIDRYAMETKRQLDVLDQRLSQTEFLACNKFTIADIASWPWYGQLVLGRLYSAGNFLDVSSYKNVVAWAEKIDRRPTASKARMVNRIVGNPKFQLHERHDASDFEFKTQDKLNGSE